MNQSLLALIHIDCWAQIYLTTYLGDHLWIKNKFVWPLIDHLSAILDGNNEILGWI